MKISKKHLVLFILFIVPLLFYIYLQMGTYNFGKLPIVTKNVIDVSNIDKKLKFKGKVTVVNFIGKDTTDSRGEIFNLNEKIYKKFYGYTDFQLISFVDKAYKSQTEALQKKLSKYTNMVKWKFLYASKEEINALYESFQTNEKLDDNIHTIKAFIIDKEVALRRGESTIKKLKKKKLFGYNMQSVAELKNDMFDDVKVVLAEYSLALKKNNRSEDRRIKSISNEEK
ncbi:thioredoxin domain-containing protein [Tenacibaculum jejuense]|uniref:Uncharacterized protein n=1 Tax=Tenacibaculum jejuense TaxID=584609 RepID=A0A238UEK2_9FLAO|nr:hypothetical protein [Tenacibaculum jejuense]SNR17522.1 conserved protein of unknown function [Tenacibaculum jejuense]